MLSIGTRQGEVKRLLSSYYTHLQPHRRELALLFLIAWCFRLVWVFLIPPWQVPDEASHFTYVAHLVEQREIPFTEQTSALPVYSKEVLTSLQNSLYYSTSSQGTPNSPPLSVLPAGYDYTVATAYSASAADRKSGGGATATAYSWVNYIIEAPAYWLFQGEPILSRLYAVRIVVAVIGALSCLVAYGIGVTLGGTTEWGRTVGLATAWFPQFTFMSAGMNNDALSILCATTLIWLTLQQVQARNLRKDRTILLGFMAALSVIVKPTTIPLAVISGMVFLWYVGCRVRHNRIALLSLLTYACGVICVFLPELLIRRYLSLQAAAIARTTVDGSFFLHGIHYSLKQYLSVKMQGGNFYLQWLFLKLSWGMFGWLDVQMSDEAYAFIALFSILGLGGAVTAFLTLRGYRHKVFIPLLFIIAQIAYTFLFIDYYISFALNGQFIGIQGRYFLPALAPFLYILISGWCYLSHNHRNTLRLVSATFLAIQLVSLMTLLQHYYGISGT